MNLSKPTKCPTRSAVSLWPHLPCSTAIQVQIYVLETITCIPLLTAVMCFYLCSQMRVFGGSLWGHSTISRGQSAWTSLKSSMGVIFLCTTHMLGLHMNLHLLRFELHIKCLSPLQMFFQLHALLCDWKAYPKRGRLLQPITSLYTVW